MTEDFELTLFDRLEMIRAVLQDITPEESYISFSGGKDSVVLSRMIDEAIPHNQYERVFINTGIEFNAITSFVKSLQEKDPRIVIIEPTRNIKKMLEEDGYPFKSKLHSELVERYQKTKYSSKSVQNYMLEDGKGGRYRCPKILRYQFLNGGGICRLRFHNGVAPTLKRNLLEPMKKKQARLFVLLVLEQLKAVSENTTL